MSSFSKLTLLDTLIDSFRKNRNLFVDYKSAKKQLNDFQYYKFPDFPNFISLTTHLRILEACAIVNTVLLFAAQLLMANRLMLDGKSLWDFLDIPEHSRYWLYRLPHPLPERVFWGRPDIIVSKNGVHYIEANLASAAGYQMQISSLIDYYVDHPFFEKELNQNNILYEDPLECLSQSIARNTSPNEMILFADVFEQKRYVNKDVKPYSGMVRLMKEIAGLNVKSEFIDKLAFDSRGVYLDSEKVESLFLSYYNPHVFEHDAQYSMIWDQKALGNLKTLDSMIEIILSNKMLFAFLSEFIEKLPLQNSLKRGFQQVVPWTRIIRNCKVSYKNSVTNLYDILLSEKETLVLKKAQSAEGKDVYLGKLVEDTKWRELVEEAMKSEKWIVQDYVRSVDDKLITIEENNLQELDCDSVISPYFSEGQFSGYLKRFLTQSSKIKTSTQPIDNHTLHELGTCFVVN